QTRRDWRKYLHRGEKAPVKASEPLWLNPEFTRAFSESEREERIRSGKVASALVTFLMPAGVTLDLFVYPDRWGYFLPLRIFCSMLAAGLWLLHTTGFGMRHYRLLGTPIAILPSCFIAIMIAVTEG